MLTKLISKASYFQFSNVHFFLEEKIKVKCFKTFFKITYFVIVNFVLVKEDFRKLFNKTFQ